MPRIRVCQTPSCVRGRRCLGQVWSEGLRYHKNLAYEFEVTQVRESAEWLLVNADIH